MKRTIVTLLCAALVCGCSANQPIVQSNQSDSNESDAENTTHEKKVATVTTEFGKTPVTPSDFQEIDLGTEIKLDFVEAQLKV